MSTTRRTLTTLALSGILAAGAAGPAVARHGADDGPGHHAGDDHGQRHGGHGADDKGAHRRGRGRDDEAGDHRGGRRGRGADDAPGHVRHGDDDGPSHH